MMVGFCMINWNLHRLGLRRLFFLPVRDEAPGVCLDWGLWDLRHVGQLVVLSVSLLR